MVPVKNCQFISQKDALMNKLINIDGKIVSSDQFIKFLRLSNEFSNLIEIFIRDKITVHAAKKRGIMVTLDEIQRTADDFRRNSGLYLARDTREWMKRSGITPKEFESFITEHVYKKKLIAALVNNEAVENYFLLNSAKYDIAKIKSFTVRTKEKAREIMALLAESPERFDEFALEDFLYYDDASGQIRKVQRSALPDETGAKIFSATKGDILGPFKADEDDLYEIIQVISVYIAKLDNSTKEKIAEAIYDEWVAERLKEHSVLY